jgi:hypothetical protein
LATTSIAITAELCGFAGRPLSVAESYFALLISNPARRRIVLLQQNGKVDTASLSQSTARRLRRQLTGMAGSSPCPTNVAWYAAGSCDRFPGAGQLQRVVGVLEVERNDWPSNRTSFPVTVCGCHDISSTWR